MTWDHKSDEQHLEQIWMPGVHSDIGGVYPEGTLGDLSLITMIDRVKTHTKLQFFDELDVSHKEGNYATVMWLLTTKRDGG
jgi:hypothetical protein